MLYGSIPLVRYELRDSILDLVPKHVLRIFPLVVISLAVVIDLSLNDVPAHHVARLVLGVVQEGQVPVIVPIELHCLATQLVFELKDLVFYTVLLPTGACDQGGVGVLLRVRAIKMV